jgi:hypothetical protein
MERFERPQRQGWRTEVIWFLACAVLSSIYCVTSASHLGPTVDEPDYVFHGMNRWRTGRHNLFMNGGIMPLPCEVQTLPLYLVERVRGDPFEVTPDCTSLLPWVRAGNLVFWWMLLAYSGHLGRQLGGPWGGRVAMAWLACEPNLLAHANLATTDLSLAACLVALLAHYRAGRVDAWAKWRWRVGLPLLLAALTFLAKASAVVYVPVVLLAVELERLGRTVLFPMPEDEPAVSFWRRAGAFVHTGLLDGVQVVGGGMLLAVLYCGFGSGSAFRGEWAIANQPHGLIGHALWQINQYCRSYAIGTLVFQMCHQEQGHGGAFLLGHWHPDGIWHYFPVALLLKIALPLLLGGLTIAVTRPRTLANAVFLAAIMLVLYSLNCRVQIGIRLFLPVIPLLGTAIAAAIVELYHRLPVGWSRGLVRIATASAISWTVIGSATAWPHALCYANEIGGGPSRNHLNLSDSNHDWGQGLPELLAWQLSHANAPLSIWYFGTDPRAKKSPLTPIALGALSPDAAREQLKGRYLAVSMSHLYGGAGQCPIGERLRRMQPADRTMTFLIYDFTQPDEVAGLGSAGE